LPSNSPPSAGPGGASPSKSPPGGSGQPIQGTPSGGTHDVRMVSHEAADSAPPANLQAPAAATAPLTLTPGENGPDLPPNWPDPHGFIPRPPTAHPMPGVPSDEPVMQHMKSYCGNDAEFTTALEDYYYSRDDARM